MRPRSSRSGLWIITTRTRHGTPGTTRSSLVSTTFGARRPSRCVARSLKSLSSAVFGKNVASTVCPGVSSSRFHFAGIAANGTPSQRRYVLAVRAQDLEAEPAAVLAIRLLVEEVGDVGDLDLDAGAELERGHLLGIVV